jgi:hypothetical protein
VDKGNNSFGPCVDYFIYHQPVYSGSNNNLYAINNWYGSDNPSSSKFHAVSPGVIYWHPYLTEPPVWRMEPKPIIPLAFSLEQNYPNPFNPQTTISFTLADPAYTTITVYNLLGQRVNTILSARLESGEHSVIWNGEDDAGSPVSSGMYLYAVQSGDNFQSKKMLVLR